MHKVRTDERSQATPVRTGRPAAFSPATARRSSCEHQRRGQCACARQQSAGKARCLPAGTVDAPASDQRAFQSRMTSVVCLSIQAAIVFSLCLFSALPCGRSSPDELACAHWPTHKPCIASCLPLPRQPARSPRCTPPAQLHTLSLGSSALVIAALFCEQPV